MDNGSLCNLFCLSLKTPQIEFTLALPASGNYPNAKQAAWNRSAAYTAGAALIAGGIK